MSNIVIVGCQVQESLALKGAEPQRCGWPRRHDPGSIRGGPVTRSHHSAASKAVGSGMDPQGSIFSFIILYQLRTPWRPNVINSGAPESCTADGVRTHASPLE